MALVSINDSCGSDGYSRLVRELQVEFEGADVDALADRIVESEAADFYWEARVDERYLGQFVSSETFSEVLEAELVRVACLSYFARHWHVGAFLVNGEGQALDLLWKRSFDDLAEAQGAFRSAH